MAYGDGLMRRQQELNRELESRKATLPSRTPRSEVRRLINEACEANGCPELAPQIKVEWNGRFTQRMGDASYSLKRIRLSTPLWPRADQKERHTTIVHEVCHLIADYKQPEKAHHGRVWKRAMHRAGFEASRCHSVDRTGLKRKTKKYTYKCRCTTHEVGPRRHKKLQAGVIYTCGRCKCRLQRDLPILKTTKIGPMTVVSF